MKDIFVMEESCYNLRSKLRLHVPKASTTKYGLETVSFRGSQIRNVLNSFFCSQFSYCLLVWMFCSKEANNEIEKLHKRALQIIHYDFSSSWDDLCMKDNSATIHVRNLQLLLTEIF